MAHHRRKRSRRKVKCTMCTPHRNGNAQWDKPHRDRKRTLDPADA